MVKLEIKKLGCGYGRKIIAKNIDACIESGQVLCLLGHNGAGKTTLLKTILGFVKPQKGGIFLNGKNINSFSPKKLARIISYVPQMHMPPFPFTALDVVTMGRTIHLGMFSSPAKKDFDFARDIMKSLEISFLENRIYTEISGGERQMVLIARALAQEPEILIMDEPTLNLDFGNQAKVLKQIRRLAQKGIGIIMASHFPDHAFLFSGKAALMQNNGQFIFGNAEEIITEKNLARVYGIGVKIVDFAGTASTRVKICVPILD